MGSWVSNGTAIAKPEELQSMVVDFELVRILQLRLQLMNRAFINRNRFATMETGEVVLVALDRTVEGFAVGKSSHLNDAFEF